MNKKAQFAAARKQIYWMIASIVIAILILAFVFTIANYRARLAQVPVQLQSELIALRFGNIPECFAASDETIGLVTPGTIDITKFTTEQMNKCYVTEEDKGFKTFNFRLKLEQSGEEIITNKYYHKDSDDLTIFKEVLVMKNQKLFKDRLIIYVQEKI